MNELGAYLKKLSATDRKSFAVRCGTSLGFIRKSIYQGKLLNPKVCVAVENESSRQVTRKMLREDWIEIWPELATPT